MCDNGKKGSLHTLNFNSMVPFLPTTYMCFIKQNLVTSLRHLIQHKDMSTTTVC